MKKKIGETSYKETAFGIIPRSKLIPLEIEGIKRAWDFVMGKFSKGKITIIPDFIQKLHEVGSSGYSRNMATSSARLKLRFLITLLQNHTLYHN